MDAFGTSAQRFGQDPASTSASSAISLRHLLISRSQNCTGTQLSATPPKVAMKSTSRRTSPSRFESLSMPTISTTACCCPELKPARIRARPSFRSSQTAFLSRSLPASSSAPSSCPVPLPFCALPKPPLSHKALDIHSKERRWEPMKTYQSCVNGDVMCEK